MIKKGLRLLAPLAVAALFTPVAHAGDIPPMPQAYPISNLYKSCSAAGDNVEREWRFAETGGALVDFDTGPGAARHLHEIAGFAPVAQGTTEEGYVRYRMTLP